MGPYKAITGHKIEYLGNKIFPSIKDVSRILWPSKKYTKQKIESLKKDKKWYHTHKIDSTIFSSTIDFFACIKADWVNLPLTTKMISSPGEMYAGKKLDYTTDTIPLEIIEWFNTKERIFLSESSQFYLELRLLINNIDKVFSIYNSFRKEKADITHLTEFQHIEFEGHVNFEKNINIFTSLIDKIIKDLLDKNLENLSFFLEDNAIKDLSFGIKKKIFRAKFEEILEVLYARTKDEGYKNYSLRNFGAWEEILTTEIFGGHVLITNFPLLQIPFYHNPSKSEERKGATAENADLILQGYREVVGSGVRIIDPKILKQKAKIFNLPVKDYAPYLDTRKIKGYKQTAGFGLGWQRLTQWILQMPYIWNTTPTPRGHTIPRP